MGIYSEEIEHDSLDVLSLGRKLFSCLAPTDFYSAGFWFCFRIKIEKILLVM